MQTEMGWPFPHPAGPKIILLTLNQRHTLPTVSVVGIALERTPPPHVRKKEGL